MKAAVIWMDREMAKVFFFSQRKMERVAIKVGQPEHHTHHRDNFDRKRLENTLFKEVVPQLRHLKKILILGPGVAKYHFRNYLMENFPAIGRNVLACETVDHPSDEEVAAYASQYFQIEELSKATGSTG